MSGLGRSGHFARVWPARWPLLTRSGQPAGRDERARSGCEREVAFVPKLATAVRRALHDGVSRQLASARSRHEQWPDRTRTDTLLSVVRGCDPCRPGAAVQAERPQRSEDERPGRPAASGAASRRPPPPTTRAGLGCSGGRRSCPAVTCCWRWRSIPSGGTVSAGTQALSDVA